MDNKTRITQFQQMTEADPENELGHFSLGKAYVDDGQFDAAVAPLERVLRLNESMSKAYQLLGEAYEQSGQQDRAIDILTKGVTVAARQGDNMPRDAMVAMLERLGAPIPAGVQALDTPSAETAPEGAETGFRCARCRRPTGRMGQPPFKGALGEKIHGHTCDACWQEWVRMGTKVINELGLALADPKAQQTYDQYLLEFLQLEGI